MAPSVVLARRTVEGALIRSCSMRKARISDSPTEERGSAESQFGTAARLSRSVRQLCGLIWLRRDSRNYSATTASGIALRAGGMNSPKASRRYCSRSQLIASPLRRKVLLVTRRPPLLTRAINRASPARVWRRSILIIRCWSTAGAARDRSSSTRPGVVRGALVIGADTNGHVSTPLGCKSVGCA